jgi:predicted nucleic acid-binding protein
VTAVFDASAVVVLLLRLPGCDVVEQELVRSEPAAPAHLDAEVLSAFVRLTRRGRLTPERAAQAIAALRQMRMRRMAIAPLLDGAWAHRHNLSAYDALYVYLAARLGAVLMTADRRLAAAPGLGVPITVVTS